jgi:hypothetical protein
MFTRVPRVKNMFFAFTGNDYEKRGDTAKVIKGTMVRLKMARPVSPLCYNQTFKPCCLDIKVHDDTDFVGRDVLCDLRDTCLHQSHFWCRGTVS